MSGYFDMLESELQAAVVRVYAPPVPVPRRSRLRVIRPSFSGLVALVSVLGAVAVLVVALGVLGRSGRTVVTPPPVTATGGTQVTLRHLLSEFAVLRRPQTAADRAGSASVGGGIAIARYTRLVRRLANGDRLFLVVEHSQPGAGGYSLGLALVDPYGAGLQASGLSPASAVVPLGITERQSTSAPTWVGLVPDGVRSVQWRFACVTVAPGPRPVLCHRARSVTVTASVLANVVATSAPGVRSGCNKQRHCTAAVQQVWFGADGQIVRTVSLLKLGPAALLSGAYSIGQVGGGVAFATQANGPLVVRRVLGGGGVRGVDFGSPVASATAGFDRLLGHPVAPYKAEAGLCNFDHTAQWINFSAYFRDGRFVGYSYGPQNAQGAPPLAKHGLVLATGNGLRIGDTMADGKALYGRAFRTSWAQGGSWSARTASGVLIGYAFGPGSNGTDIGPQSRVVTIEAGAVGCPAVAP